MNGFSFQLCLLVCLHETFALNVTSDVHILEDTDVPLLAVSCSLDSTMLPANNLHLIIKCVKNKNDKTIANAHE